MSALLSAIEAELEFAFQPIVNVHTGEAYGFEALVRGTDRLGFATIRDFFEHLTMEDIVVEGEFALREKAVAAFMTFAGGSASKLFVNLNNRIIDSPRYNPRHIQDLLRRYGLPFERYCLEISEMDGIKTPWSFVRKKWRGLIAIDDFGMGHSGLKLLIELRPEIVKIDRFFISGVDADRSKQAFLQRIVSLAHSLDVEVVAEGVETEGEFRVCRDAGVEYVQGFYIARPSTDLSTLSAHYAIVEETNLRSLRRGPEHLAGCHAQLDRVRPIAVDDTMSTLLEAFRREHNRSFFPVVDVLGEPLGIVHEHDIKPLIYAPSGHTMLTEDARRYRIADFVKHAPVFDTNANVDRILQRIANDPDVHAALITERGTYVGLIDARSTIRTMHERMIRMARDQNPLTNLPGNGSIADYLLASIASGPRPLVLAYFDFDHFKAFNDHLGFRQGDRAIRMFADLLRSSFGQTETFLGHIGGDDFFLGASGEASLEIVALLPRFAAQFTSDAQSFYDPSSRANGQIAGFDRDGEPRYYPLLSVSAGCIIMTEPGCPLSVDGISTLLATLKRRAKRLPSKVAIDYLARPERTSAAS